MKIEIMGKKILTAMIVAVVAVVAGYNIYVSQKDITLSELALANIEALASSGEGFQSDCNTYCMTSYFDTCIIRYTNNTFTTCYDSRIRR